MGEEILIKRTLLKIRFARVLPNLIALLGIALIALNAVAGFSSNLLSIIPVAFIASLVWYFNLKCPKCGKTFVPFLTFNTNKWVNPKVCRSCDLPLYNK